MKKLVGILVLVVAFQPLVACDICGCSSGNYFLGPTPQFSKHFVGVRYSLRSFNTVLANDKTQFSKDLYQTAEVFGGFKIKRKIEILTFVPFNRNRSLSDDGKKMNSGFSDLTVIGMYDLFDKIKLSRDSLSISQQLWLGAGVKMPTGKFSIDKDEPVSSANNQPGTGSFDFVLTASYTLLKGKQGFTSFLSYKMNQSASGFKFGNRFASGAFLFRSLHCKKTVWTPNAGLLYEYSDPNEMDKNKIQSTGGKALLAATGLEMRLDKTILGANVEHPLIQNISDSQTKINLRGMIHLVYAF